MVSERGWAVLVPAQSSSGLVELPLEILEMVAQMLPDAFSLAQMHQGSTGLHSACSRRRLSSRHTVSP